MKYFIYIILFFLSYSLTAQERKLTKKEDDSIFELIMDSYILNDQSEFGKAIEINKEVILYLEDTEDNFLLGKAYNSLAYSYAELKEKDKAFEYSFKARDYFVKAKDTANIIIIYNDVGVTYEDFDMIEEATANYKKSLKLGKALEDYEAIVFTSYNIGSILVEYKKQYTEALPYFEQALYHAKSAKFSDDEAIYGDIYSSLSYAYYKLNKLDDSQKFYNKALDLATKNKYLYIEELLYKERAKLYKEDEKYKEALKMMENYDRIKDSIFKKSNVALAKTIEAKHKVKTIEENLRHVKKDQEIQEAQLEKSNRFMLLFGILTALLILAVYWTVKKNRELKLARDVAENLSKVKSDFYSEISHELRTPLYAVIELSNLLQKEDINIEHKEYLESLQFSGNQLLSLINNVLELNKVDSGTVKIELSKLHLKDILSSTIDSIEFALHESNNVIYLDYDDSIPKKLVGDSLKLTQVFINLISNAIKFTNNGKITVTAKMVKENDQDVKINFRVTDTGLGIAKEKQNLVFENFYQEHAKIEKSYRGTGLGLSIVKSILTAMGSEIKIESEEGKGSTFYFNLIFNKTEEANSFDDLYSNQLKAIEGKRVLIVDDNKINQLVTRKVLSQLKMESLTVDSGIKAIELVKKESFDCILMDLHMPQLDGYETTRLIREFNTGTPIVALTAASTDEVEEKIKEQDMNGYVLKPFNTSDFVSTLHKAICSVYEKSA